MGLDRHGSSIDRRSDALLIASSHGFRRRSRAVQQVVTGVATAARDAPRCRYEMMSLGNAE
jgi:hypothetical protein